VIGDFVIFSWLLIRLPGAEMPARVALKGAVLASLGFEVLKIVGTFTIAKTSSSPTAGPFAGLLAVLIWIQFVARFMLFCAAWMSVLTDEQATASAAVDESVEVVNEPEQSPPMNPAALGVTLVGAGAIAGAAAATAVTVAVTSRRGQGSRGRD
jgi:membrane protein